MAVSGVEYQQHDHVDREYQHHVNRSGGNDQRAHRADRDSDADSGGHSDSRFTPSGASQGQDPQGNAGTYQVTQIQFFSAAAFALLAQTGSSSPSQTPAASTASTAGTTPASDPNVTTPSLITPAIVQVVPPGVAQTPSLTAPAAPATTTATSTPAASAPVTQDPLQAFNAALQSLGLSDQQIKAFDQVANLINSISPAVFADLVTQLQTLAQQASQGTQSSTGATANSAASPSSDTASTAAAAATPTSTGAPTSVPPTAVPANSGATASGAAQPTGPYQIEELSIKFSGVDIQGNTGATSGTSNSAGVPFDISAFNLSIQEVKVTLADGNGQTSQISTSQPPASNAASSTQGSVAGTATA